MTTSKTSWAGPLDARESPRATWLHEVTISGGIWARRQDVNRKSALPHGYRMLETAGNFENLRIAAGQSTATYRGPVFMDSDVYKWLEAAAYEIARVPDESLVASMQTAIDPVEAAPSAAIWTWRSSSSTSAATAGWARAGTTAPPITRTACPCGTRRRSRGTRSAPRT